MSLYLSKLKENSNHSPLNITLQPMMSYTYICVTICNFSLADLILILSLILITYIVYLFKNESNYKIRALVLYLIYLFKNESLSKHGFQFK